MVRAGADVSDEKLELSDALFDVQVPHAQTTVDDGAEDHCEGSIPIESDFHESGTGWFTLESGEVLERE